MYSTRVSPRDLSRKRSTRVLTTSPAQPAHTSIRDCGMHPNKFSRHAWTWKICFLSDNYLLSRARLICTDTYTDTYSDETLK